MYSNNMKTEQQMPTRQARTRTIKTKYSSTVGVVYYYTIDHSNLIIYLYGVGNNFHVCVVIMEEVRLVNRYIIYIFYHDIVMLVTTMQVRILYNTVWVILFVVEASLLLYRTVNIYIIGTFDMPTSYQ